jgi:hypothetical protein
MMADVVEEEEEEEDYEDEDGDEHEGHPNGHGHQQHAQQAEQAQHAQHAQHVEHPDAIQEEEEEDQEDEQRYEDPDGEHDEDALQGRPEEEVLRQGEGHHEADLRLQKEARDADSALLLLPPCNPSVL